MKKRLFAGGIGAAALVGLGFTLMSEQSNAQTRSNPPASIDLKTTFDVPAPDAQAEAIVASADAFLASLNEAETAKVLFDLSDDAQRANWSNFPEGVVDRQGLRRDEMSAEQWALLEQLLGTVMSDKGLRNVHLQLAAEDTLDGWRFSSDYYYVSFLGMPSVDAPWMLQFGGHHLAINVTFFGPDLTFSPMLTGGEPLNITFEGEEVFIAGDEAQAARGFLDLLDEDQRAVAVRSNSRASLLLGPGEFGTVVAAEGIKGSELNMAQRAALLDVIAIRMGFMNADDFAAKMAVVEAGLDETYFGWWGPQDGVGTAYYRITGPDLVMEYSPERGDAGGYGDHAHNMYRDPQNDYGSVWLSAE